MLPPSLSLPEAEILRMTKKFTEVRRCVVCGKCLYLDKKGNTCSRACREELEASKK
jgi:predicted nucleic acid-binding Zn ribbon protein